MSGIFSVKKALDFRQIYGSGIIGARAFMASRRADYALLKSAEEFGRAEMGESSGLIPFGTGGRALCYHRIWTAMK